MIKITLHSFLSAPEINKAKKLQDRKKVRDEIIVPNMERINKDLEQENDPDYLSFLVEYVMKESGHWK